MLTGEPFIPQTITVHLGYPDTSAPNVTLPFPDYVKNVASSEIFPTWPETALRANIYAFNAQSRRMFQSVGFQQIDEEWYRLCL